MSDQNINESLSEKEVNDVLNAWNFLEFENSYKSTYYNTYFTPDIVNQQMKNINMNPVEATINGIEQALNNPKDSEFILRAYSEDIELKNMYYKRLIRYFSDMACFNLTFDPINIEKESDYNSKEFKNDLKVLDDFCSKFDFKEEFQTVFRQMLRQGVYYCILRDNGDKYTLQELPSNFCKITGRFPYGLLFDFDMNWFIGNYGIDINMYPKIFKKMYRDVFRSNKNLYDPSNPIDKRNSSFVYWHQCSPEDGFWAWKISPEIANIVPYFSALFPDMSYQPIVRGLQNDKYFIEASKLLVGIIGFNKDAKSGQVANQINMTPDMLGKFLGVARKGLNKQIGLVALPVEEIKAVEFDTDNDNIVTDYTSNISKQSIAASTTLMSDEKLNSHQSKLASAIDINFVLSIYPMFENFVEFFVNSKTSRFKFKVKFHDVNVPDDKSERQTRFRELASMGIVDIQQASRVCDMNPFEFSRSLSLTKAMGLQDKLTSLISLNNQSAQENIAAKRGRPKIDSPDNDNTEASQARGSNELKVT